MENIGDYAAIGDCRSAALVSRTGSIDWLCWPRFDSPSVFGALIHRGGGRWRIRPVGEFSCERRYVESTNVLSTTFKQGSSRLTLTDWMPVAADSEKRRLLLADHEILRSARCDRGEMELEMTFEPRPDFGREPVRLRSTALAHRVETSLGLLALRTEFPLKREGDRLRGRLRLSAGRSACSSLTFADDAPAVFPPSGDRTRESLDRSVAWWRSWSARLRYDGPFRTEVLRSALALKLLVYAPSGAIVAAPTTSLPERLGGDLNWDYRYCWLRDASLTVRALVGLGCIDEAEAFTYWLIHTTALTRPRLRVLYDLFGKRPPRETTIESLTGYRGSRPVRIGNRAEDQLQLDVYGEVIHAAFELIRAGADFDRESRKLICGFGNYLRGHWREPDEGLWEPRSGRLHHTHSRLLCWAGLDRLIEMHGKGHVCSREADDLLGTREAIRIEIESKAWNQSLESYAATLGGDQLDSSLLLLSWYGFERPDSHRMRRTYQEIRRRLGAADVLLYRNRFGDAPGEGAFGACGFWAAEYLALGGASAAEAEDCLRRLLGYANDVGLFAEEIDPESGMALGNFPQGFTHVGVINSAISLSRRLRGERPVERELTRSP